MNDEQEALASAVQESLGLFARLREQMRRDGPKAVAASLNSMPASDLRQVVLALVLTTERAADSGSTAGES